VGACFQKGDLLCPIRDGFLGHVGFLIPSEDGGGGSQQGDFAGELAEVFVGGHAGGKAWIKDKRGARVLNGAKRVLCKDIPMGGICQGVARGRACRV
jgi:hypothetical protein